LPALDGEHLNASVKIKEMDALNTYDHTLVLATAGVDVKNAAPKAAKILTKPRWGKCDHDIYKDCIQNFPLPICSFCFI
jgi:hypothetical protein